MKTLDELEYTLEVLGRAIRTKDAEKSSEAVTVF
jgi:hypothetical protein